MSSPGKVDHQPAFVLHAQAYKETSLIVELFTRDHGRVSVVGRGATDTGSTPRLSAASRSTRPIAPTSSRRSSR